MSEHKHARHAGAHSNQQRLAIALAITALMTVVELVGGLLSNSLALLGDAAHMFTDTLALGLSLFALRLARRPADPVRTFGYLRAEILAALINGTVLIGVAGFIFYEAYHRFYDPPEIAGGLMLVVASVGLVANGIGIHLLHSGSRHNLNVRGAFLHMWGDALSSIGVIAAGVVVVTTGWSRADPIISVLIGALIMKGALGLVWESTNILLEAAPRHIDPARLAAAVSAVPGVREIHDVHLWTITSGVHAMSAHLLIDDQMVSNSTQIIEDVNHLLASEFGIAHSTLQLECTVCDSSPVCQIQNHR